MILLCPSCYIFAGLIAILGILGLTKLFKKKEK